MSLTHQLNRWLPSSSTPSLLSSSSTPSSSLLSSSSTAVAITTPIFQFQHQNQFFSFKLFFPGKKTFGRFRFTWTIFFRWKLFIFQKTRNSWTWKKFIKNLKRRRREAEFWFERRKRVFSLRQHPQSLFIFIFNGFSWEQFSRHSIKLLPLSLKFYNLPIFERFEFNELFKF